MPHTQLRGYSDQEWASVVSGSWLIDEPTWDRPLLSAKTRISSPWLGREYGSVYRNLVRIDRRTIQWLQSVLGLDRTRAERETQLLPMVRQNSSAKVKCTF